LKTFFKTFLFLFFGLIIIAKAQGPNHNGGSTAHNPSQQPTVTLPGNESVPGNASSTSPSPSLTNSQDSADDQKIKKLNSSVSLFWNVMRNNKVNDTLLSAAGIDSKDFQTFEKSLSKKDRLSKKQLSMVRADPDRTNFAYRIHARKKFLKMVSNFQELNPDLAKFLPEILTAWGEARNLDGFSEGDLLYQQAKIASVIHVLRNRVERQCKIKKLECSEDQKNKLKWALATRRYQFSCFEPYDVNLAPVLLGSKNSKMTSLEDLPSLDQKSLENIIVTLVKLEKNQIQIDAPLGNNNSRHYITPVLVPYSKNNLEKTKKNLELEKSKALLLVPTQKPTHITVVPNWAKQSALISHPKIFVQNTRSGDNTEQIIAPLEFVYFGGLQ